MLNLLRFNKLLAQLQLLVKPLLIGDWFVVIASILCVLYLFQSLWTNEHAAKVQIRLGDTVYALSLIHI